MARIQVRRGAATAWASANPTLAQGELGYDITNDTVKIGDGATPWSSLPGLGGGGGSVPLDDDAIADLIGDGGSATSAAIGALVASEVDLDKLAGIEAGADVTDSTNVAAAGAVMESTNDTISGQKTFSQPVQASTAPTLGAHLANKTYVDAGDAAAVTLTGNQTIGGNKTFSARVTLPSTNPGSDTHAAHKGYVDEQVNTRASSSAFSSLTALLKYVGAVWVLEADEDESDLPGDFPTAPLFTGGPPPIVLRKREV